MKISVVIPSFNRANLLPRTVQTVIEQTYNNLEVIIVDDCSIDNTSEVVAGLQSKWPFADIRYIKHETNKGESGARNTGIRHATGELIAFLDSDDEWLDNKLELQIKFLHENRQFDGVVCEYYIISTEDGASQVINFNDHKLSNTKLLTHGCGFCVGTNLLVKRSLITADFDEQLRLFADIDWLYRTLSSVSIGVLHVPLSRYYKAPMRRGELIKEYADLFVIKYQPVVKQLSFSKKCRFYSTINWYIALAYDYHKNYKLAIKHYTYGLLQMPFKRLGNYINVLVLLYNMTLEKKCN